MTQANDAISPIFNKEKEQNRLQAVQMVSDIGNQVADIVRTQSDLDGLKAAIAKTGTSLQGLPEKERLAKLAALRDTDVYKKVTENTGTGSDVQRAITAATAAVSGLAGGNLNAGLTGAAAPYIASEIGKTSLIRIRRRVLWPTRWSTPCWRKCRGRTHWPVHLARWSVKRWGYSLRRRCTKKPPRS
ncbi:hypothetical protein [Cronobacter malonaticus]|uniref:hypothetical protein n=1 Tax=Cronobacter malonaticus TaxID=413503 RepID=UPI0018902290|nr:hypothetical protein [Cronobacter malonaticus]MBF4851193.1 hypothetical protein [Cronobacter malonaticus]